MTTNVRPRRMLDGKLNVLYGDGTNNVIAVECEVYNPPGWRGRKVYVFLDVQDTTDLLLELRAAAVHARSKGEVPST